MKNRNQTSTRKCSDRAVWMLSTWLIRLKRVDSAGDMPEPGDERERGGDEDRDEVGEQLQAVVGDPAVLGRPVQRQVLDQHRQRRWETRSQLVGTRRRHWPVANNRT